MCGRYTLGKFEKNLGYRFETSNQIEIETSYNICPGQYQPVITRNSPNRVSLMKWGLIPFWSNNPSVAYKTSNARAEGLENKPTYRKPIRSQRCLVPATGFYEWQTITLEDKPEKIPYHFRLKDGELFAFAGIYDIWRDAEGKSFYTYSIITCEPNELVAQVHDRMPVILNAKDEDAWLDIETPLPDILKLLVPYDASNMDSYRVSKDVSWSRNDSPELIKPFKT